MLVIIDNVGDDNGDNNGDDGDDGDIQRPTVKVPYLGKTVCPPRSTEVRYPITVPTHSSPSPRL